MAIVIQYYESIQYTESNAADVVAWMPNSEHVSTRENGTLDFLVTAYGETYPIHVPMGYWALRCDGIFQGAIHPGTYPTAYYELPGT